MTRLLLWIAIIFGGLSLVGCDGAARPVPVTGVVIYGGMPVAGAQVMFTPTNGRPAEGTTDEQGKFKLTTTEPGDGALPGSHQVTIVKMARREGTDPNDPYAVMDNVLPAKYAKPGSVLVEVKSKGSNEFPFSLTD